MVYSRRKSAWVALAVMALLGTVVALGACDGAAGDDALGESGYAYTPGDDPGAGGGACTGSPTPLMLKVPWLPQVPPGTWTTTRNCGPASYAMVDAYLTDSPASADTIEAIDDWMSNNIPGWSKNNYNGSNTSVGQMVTLASGYGSYPNAAVFRGSCETIKAQLLAGRPVIVVVDTQSSNNYPSTTMKTSGDGHLVDLVGIDDQYVYVNDPGRSAPINGCGADSEPRCAGRRFTLASFDAVWAKHGRAGVVLGGTAGGCTCGDGTCQAGCGETCASCEADCGCSGGTVCNQAAQCVTPCGGLSCPSCQKCDGARCVADAAQNGSVCGGGTCQNGQCTCVPSCAGKCGGAPDGCGGACTGSCGSGCCSGQTCVSGATSSACGNNGAACATCGASQTCSSGVCQACGGTGQQCCSGSCNNPYVCNGETCGCGTGNNGQFVVADWVYPNWGPAGCSGDNSLKLQASAAMVSPTVLRVYVRKADNTTFSAGATLSLYVGAGPTCPNPVNVVKATAPIIGDQSVQTIDLMVNPYGGAWNLNETKTFWVGKDEGGFQAWRATGLVSVNRICM